MKKSACFIVVGLMIILGVGVIESAAASSSSNDIATSDDGKRWEKYRTIPEAESSVGFDKYKSDLIYGGSVGDRVKGEDQADFRLDADASAPENDCMVECYVSPTGSDSIESASNDCLDASSPCSSIQHAIDISTGTEECPVVIHVAAGTYSAHLVMNSWESLDGGWNSDFSQQWDFEFDWLEPEPKYATIIDGGDDGTCITQNAIAGADINGFTIQKGRGVAGGIYLDHSHPTITNCMIKDNYGESYSKEIRTAGGLYAYYSNPTVENCDFRSNDCMGVGGLLDACAVLNEYSQAVFVNSSFSETDLGQLWQEYEYKGSGIVNVNSSPIITKCRFEDNGFGGAARCPLVNFDSSVIVKDSLFNGNHCGEGGPGAIENYGSEVTIVNSLFINNEAVQTGSAATVGNESETVCTIHNSIFAGNSSLDNEWGQILGSRNSELTVVSSTFSDSAFDDILDFGAVIKNGENAHGTVKNSIIWGSLANEETGDVFALYTDESSTLEASFSDIDQDGFESDNGNIRLDPKFVQVGWWDDNDTPDTTEDDVWMPGDYHLQKDSPCIDTGTQEDVTLEETDFEGDSRVMDGNLDLSTQVDMGADEFDPTKGLCFIMSAME